MKEEMPKIESNEEKINIQDLPADQQGVVEKLEVEARDLFAKKNELDYYYQELIECLPKKKNKAGKEVNLNWEDIQNLYDQDKEKLLTEIDSNIQRKMEEKDPTDNNTENDEELKVSKLMQLTESLEKGVNLHQEIKQIDPFEKRSKKLSEAKTAEEKEEVLSEENTDVRAFAKYKNMVLREVVETKKELDQKKEKIDGERAAIEVTIRAGKSDRSLFKAVALRKKKFKEMIESFQEFVISSPEAYYLEAADRLKNISNIIGSGGRIIETSYVKSIMKRIDGDVNNNRPVFIHGELGSGKTELSKHYCHKAWVKKNPRPKNPAEIEKWEQEKKEKAEPYLISGHKNLDISEVFGERAAQVKEPLKPEEQVKVIQEAVENYKKECQKKGEKIDEMAIQNLTDLYKQSFEEHLEVKPIMGLFYKAMAEGRPIILDELNAIPHTALISLNNLLTLKPGDRVTPMIPGIGSFTVQEGFFVLATGNWKPEDGKTYFGRQGLDSAFLSRFGVINYDYLPQRITGETAGADSETQRKEKAENELYDIMLCSLMDESLGVDAPEKTTEKLKALARSARTIQDIFSEKDTESRFHDLNKDRDIPAKEVIKENVLSIRHILPILANWRNEGFSHSLESYILKDYLERSSHARDNEKMALYQILQTNGLFPTDQAWPNSMSPKGMKEFLNIEVIEKMYGHDKVTELELPETIIDEEASKRKRISLLEVIEDIYGSLPQRKKISSRFLNEKKKEGSVDLDLEKMRQLDEINQETKELFEKTMDKLDKDKKDKEIIENIKDIID